MSAESDMEYSDNDDYDYYGEQDDCDMDTVDRTKTDPEYFVYTCLKVEEVEKLLNESIELLSNSLQITPSLAKVWYLFFSQDLLDGSMSVWFIHSYRMYFRLHFMPMNGMLKRL